MRATCFTFFPHCAQYPGLSPGPHLSSSLQWHPLEQAVILKLMRLDHWLGGSMWSAHSKSEAKDLDFLPLAVPGLGLQDLLKPSLDQDKWEDSVLFYISLPLAGMLRHAHALMAKEAEWARRRCKSSFQACTGVIFANIPLGQHKSHIWVQPC